MNSRLTEYTVFQRFMAAGVGVVSVCYPVWNDVLGVSSAMKRSDIIMFVGLIASGGWIAMMTYLMLYLFKPRVAVAIGMLGWVLFGLAALEQGFEIAKKVG